MQLPNHFNAPTSHDDTHLLAADDGSSTGGGGGGGGGAVAVVAGLHLAPVEAAVAPAGRARQRRRRAHRARRHELPAPVHGVPADGRSVVALALPVVHHLRLLAPRRWRAVRHGRRPVLLRPHRSWKLVMAYVPPTIYLPSFRFLMLASYAMGKMAWCGDLRDGRSSGNERLYCYLSRLWRRVDDFFYMGITG